MPTDSPTRRKVIRVILSLVLVSSLMGLFFILHWVYAQLNQTLDNTQKFRQKALDKLSRQNLVIRQAKNREDSLRFKIQTMELEIDALSTKDYYLLLDLTNHRFYLMKSNLIIYTDHFGSGKGQIRIKGEKIDFKTPRREFIVTKKETNPWWVRPDWFWTEQNLPIPTEFLTIPEDLSYSQAVRYYNHLSATDKLRVRRVPGYLGKYKITLQDGYLIHYGAGVGRNSSHGCIRVSKPSLEVLFNYLEVNSPVYIF